MKLTFLGSGGGRFSAISQRRMTGGFRIDNLGGKNYHVDPGPGALVRTYQFGFDPRNLDGIFVSHAHTDHYNDAEILIEAMTQGMTKNRGVIVGSRSVIDGYTGENFNDYYHQFPDAISFTRLGPSISKYHQSKSKKIILESDVVQSFDKISVKGTKTEHGDSTGSGFQLDYNGFKLSYTSDTAYFEDLASQHEGADILIASVLRPGNKAIAGHMCSNEFAQLIMEVKPKLAIMTHFGLKMLSSNPVKEAHKIAKKTGVRIIAAFDGLSCNINYNNPSYFRIISLKDVNNQKHSCTHGLYDSGRRNSYYLSKKNREYDEFKMLRR